MIDSVSDQAGAGAGADLKKTRRQKPSLAQRGSTTLDRLPPHSSECEQGVIGCCLLDPACLDEAIGRLNGDLEVFYDLRHRTIFEHLSAMRAEMIGIDLITVTQRLTTAQMLAQVGGIPYLSQLQDSVPSTANLKFYLDAICEKHLLRRYIYTCTGIVGRIYDYEGEVDKVCDEVEKEILAINASKSSEVTTRPLNTLMHIVTDKIEDAVNNHGQLTGLSTGFHDLDSKTDGLHPGEMYVIAARPSVGKTSLAMNIADHVAIELALPVMVFSMEMTDEQLVERMMASRARVNIRALKNGHLLMQQDMVKLTHTVSQMNGKPLFIDPTPGLSILQMRSRARRMVKQHGIKLFVIDYLQLAHSSTVTKNDTREREVADISQGIKAMAKELNVPVIVLSQLNREVELKGGKPKMSQLRESGSIEQDADFVGLLYKTNSTSEDDPDTQAEADTGLSVTLHIAKQRNGESGCDILLTFLKQYTRFESQAPSYGIPEPSYHPHNDN